jgi:hypothetical protein
VVIGIRCSGCNEVCVDVDGIRGAGSFERGDSDWCDGFDGLINLVTVSRGGEWGLVVVELWNRWSLGMKEGVEDDMMRFGRFEIVTNWVWAARAGETICWRFMVLFGARTVEMEMDSGAIDHVERKQELKGEDKFFFPAKRQILEASESANDDRLREWREGGGEERGTTGRESCVHSRGGAERGSKSRGNAVLYFSKTFCSILFAADDDGISSLGLLVTILALLASGTHCCLSGVHTRTTIQERESKPARGNDKSSRPQPPSNKTTPTWCRFRNNRIEKSSSISRS